MIFCSVKDMIHNRHAIDQGTDQQRTDDHVADATLAATQSNAANDYN